MIKYSEFKHWDINIKGVVIIVWHFLVLVCSGMIARCIYLVVAYGLAVLADGCLQVSCWDHYNMMTRWHVHQLHVSICAPCTLSIISMCSILVLILKCWRTCVHHLLCHLMAVVGVSSQAIICMCAFLVFLWFFNF